MAWSYTAGNQQQYKSDGSHFAYWWNQWTVTEVPGEYAGKIRLRVSLKTNGYGQAYANGDGTYSPSGYVWYCTDSVSCNNETKNIQNGYVPGSGYASSAASTYTKYVDVPNDWAGRQVVFNIAWRQVTVTLGASKTFSLGISAGSGSSVAATRNLSNVGAAGALSSGDIVYNGDQLQIVFTPDTDYGIVTHTVNGTTFTSGNTHIVASDVSVVSTALPLASDVGATDANIGSASTITVTRYSGTYYHSLQYSFGQLSGYIGANGAVSQTEAKFNTTSVAFTVPDSFYAEIPNAKTGVCTITCRTYLSASSAEQLGDSKTCTFTVTAAEANCGPLVGGTVVDTNATTTALTGDSSTLIRYMSSALCTISATARGSASVVSKLINGAEVQTNQRAISGDSLVSADFSFSATDSRGYTGSVSVQKTMVAYIKLTLNPVVFRPAPTTGEISVTFDGNYYRGSFGAYSNTLTLQYRYRESTGATWSSWATIQQAGNYEIGTKRYQSSREIPLTDKNGSDTGFDYQKSYIFQVRAFDGANGTALSTVTVETTVQRGIPVFDWGENDFNFNVPVKLNGLDLIDVFYPVGSVYITEANAMPSPLADLGTWVAVTTGITGMNGWKRTV